MNTLIKLISLLFICGIFNFELFGSEKTDTSRSIFVTLSLPVFDRNHQNPYIALWLSNDDNEYKVLSVKRGNVKWLSSLKTFWRNIARENRNESDAVTGATNRNKKLSYEFKINKSWDYIFFEVARENGKKELIKMPLLLEDKCVLGNFEIEKACVQIFDI
ncbi:MULTISPECIES: DUF2271 domain-containing protein [unclassified Pseudoalteromonas]|uniref:DUF2271 domain-containing protein n=1 Tax=unclassified Pseudoalteromonas TaxID=194690 RepID=UPI00390C9AAD